MSILMRRLAVLLAFLSSLASAQVGPVGQTVCPISGCPGGGGGGGGVTLQGSTPGTPDTGNLNVTGTAIAGALNANGGNLTLTKLPRPAAAPTVELFTPAGPTPMDAGTYVYVTTWVTADGGETDPSDASSPITTTGTQIVIVTRPGSPPALATGWRVYRSGNGPDGYAYQHTGTAGLGGTIPLGTTTFDDYALIATLDAAVFSIPYVPANGGKDSTAGQRIYSYGALAGFLGATSTSYGVGSYNPSAAGLYTDFNTSFGAGSLAATGLVGGDLTAMGGDVLTHNTTGVSNTGGGAHSLAANTTGSYLTAWGDGSLGANTTARYNTAGGYFSCPSVTTGEDNTCFGAYTYAGTTNGGNTAIGTSALRTATGQNNTAVGHDSLRLNMATGDWNTSIGSSAGVSTAGLSYTLTLGANATATVNGHAVVGDTNVTDVYFGTESATAKIHAGNFAGILSGTTSSIGGSLLAGAGTCASGTATVTGAVVGNPVVASASDGTLPNGLVTISASVTSANTVSVQECAIAAVTPAAKTFSVRVLQ